MQPQTPIHRFHVLANPLLDRHIIPASASVNPVSPHGRLTSDQVITMPSNTDIVTLDNFRDRLPPWVADSPNQLYAIVDMGR